MQDSNIDLDTIDLDRAGVIWGSGIGGIKTFYDEVSAFAKGDGTPRFNPFFIPKMISDIASEAYNVVIFFALAFILTILAVYWYSRSWTLTFLPLVCSLTSLVWQFGMLKVLGFGLDPLAILVPFLVFAIGVSHEFNR